MEYRILGKTGLKVSRVGLGGIPIQRIDAASAKTLVHQLMDKGVNFIDTANCYSFGTSEEYIGQSLKNLGIPRNKIALASKVYFNDGKLGRDAISREIDGTLKRLQTDYLDLYQIHRFDYSTPIEETMEALHRLVQSGKVRAIGASAMTALGVGVLTLRFFCLIHTAL